MKMTALLAIILSVICSAARGQLVMNAGDSYTHHFTTLPFGHNETVLHLSPGAHFVLQFDNATVDSGDSLLMEMFEGSAAEPAVWQQTLSGPAWIPLLSSSTVWADHQGAVRVTALAGSFVINELIMQRNEPVIGGSFDVYQLRVTPVPEPSTIAFAGLGALILSARLALRRRLGILPSGSFPSSETP